MNLVFFIILLPSLGMFMFVAIMECRPGFFAGLAEKIDKPPKAALAFGGLYRQLPTFPGHEYLKKIDELLNPKTILRSNGNLFRKIFQEKKN